MLKLKNIETNLISLDLLVIHNVKLKRIADYN